MSKSNTLRRPTNLIHPKPRFRLPLRTSGLLNIYFPSCDTSVYILFVIGCLLCVVYGVCSTFVVERLHIDSYTTLNGDHHE